MSIKESSAVFRGGAAVGKAAGAIDLGRYPGLCHAPNHWGEGIRFACNGVPVEDLAASIAATSLTSLVGEAADRLGVPFADVLDALKYLRDRGAI